ncbi:unnamed protein product [Ixodes pacificus]
MNPQSSAGACHTPFARQEIAIAGQISLHNESAKKMGQGRRNTHTAKKVPSFLRFLSLC